MKFFGLAFAALLIAPATALAQHEHAGAEKLGIVNFETSCQPATRALRITKSIMP